jgi:hypothetical protein
MNIDPPSINGLSVCEMSQADELIEDWPRRMSDCSTIARACRRKRKILQHHVTFSVSSSMQLYHLDEHYAQAKSYSKDDCKGFSRESMMEAIRITKLILSSTPPDDASASTSEKFEHLLKTDVISSEDIRGIEHLILCKSPSKLLQKRRDHASAVLSMQHRMETLAKEDINEAKVQDYLVKKLATFSASRSSISAKHARTRASMAVGGFR